MTSFQQLVSEMNRKCMVDDAYMLGVDCFIEKRAYENPFAFGTIEYKDFENGYLDAQYMQN